MNWWIPSIQPIAHGCLPKFSKSLSVTSSSHFSLWFSHSSLSTNGVFQLCTFASPENGSLSSLVNFPFYTHTKRDALVARALLITNIGGHLTAVVFRQNGQKNQLPAVRKNLCPHMLLTVSSLLLHCYSFAAALAIFQLYASLSFLFQWAIT